MEPQAPATTGTGTGAAVATASSQPSEPSHPSQPPTTSLPPPSPSSSSSSPSLSAPLHSSPNPNPNPTPRAPSPSPSPLPSTSRPPTVFNRPHYPHFSSPPPPVTSSSPSITIPGPSAPSPRGGMAIGVPAHHQSPSPPFSSSFGQHFGGLARTAVNIPDTASNSPAVSPVRAPAQGMGMLGSLGSNPQMRPGGMPPTHQHRPVQSSLRPPSPQSNQSTASQVSIYP